MTADLAGLWESIQSEPVFWLLLLAGAVVAVALAAVTSGSHDYPQRNPGDDLAEYHDARAELHCLDEKPIDHDEVARFLAMHAGAAAAKRRRIASGEQQMERIWRNTTGGGSDAA